MPRLGASRRWWLAGLLVGSLALNGYLLLRGSASSSRAAGRTATPAMAAKTVGVPARERPVRRCKQRLQLCRLQSWRLAMVQAKPERAETPAARTEPKVEPKDETGYGAQRAALCSIGLKQLRRNWTHGRKIIRENLLRDLQDPEKQRQDMQRYLDDFDVALNLTGRQRSALEREYLPLRDARVSHAVKALQADPPDYETVLDEALSLYADEDRMLQQMFGDEQLRRARASQLERRTAVISILAAMADVPWDQELAW